MYDSKIPFSNQPRGVDEKVSHGLNVVRYTTRNPDVVIVLSVTTVIGSELSGPHPYLLVFSFSFPTTPLLVLLGTPVCPILKSEIKFLFLFSDLRNLSSEPQYKRTILTERPTSHFWPTSCSFWLSDLTSVVLFSRLSSPFPCLHPRHPSSLTRQNPLPILRPTFPKPFNDL